MARVEDDRQSHSWCQRLHQNVVQLVVDYLSRLVVVHWKDRLVETVVLVSISAEIGSLATVSRIVKKQRVSGDGSLHQPLHGRDHVAFGGTLSVVCLVVGQDDHRVRCLLEPIRLEELSHADHVVDASSQCGVGAGVVDTDE